MAEMEQTLEACRKELRERSAQLHLCRKTLKEHKERIRVSEFEYLCHKTLKEHKDRIRVSEFNLNTSAEKHSKSTKTELE